MDPLLWEIFWLLTDIFQSKIAYVMELFHMQHSAVWYKQCEATYMAFTVPLFSLPGQTEHQTFQFPINEGQPFCKVVVFVYGPSVFALWIFYKSSWTLKIIYHSFEKLEVIKWCVVSHWAHVLLCFFLVCFFLYVMIVHWLFAGIRALSATQWALKLSPNIRYSVISVFTACCCYSVLFCKDFKSV